MNLNPFELMQSETLPVKTYQYYGDDKPEFDECAYDYDELLESVNLDVDWTIKAQEYNYQGDYFYFGEYANRFYFVVIGYGSCSGCDALQACSTYTDMVDLRDDIKRDIREFDSLQEFKVWFDEHVQNQWYDGSEVENFTELFKNVYNIELKWEREEW